jgi:hypothetical protein
MEGMACPAWQSYAPSGSELSVNGRACRKLRRQIAERRGSKESVAKRSELKFRFRFLDLSKDRDPDLVGYWCVNICFDAWCMPRIGACCELGWREPFEARVRSVGVLSPLLNCRSGN